MVMGRNSPEGSKRQNQRESYLTNAERAVETASSREESPIDRGDEASSPNVQKAVLCYPPKTPPGCRLSSVMMFRDVSWKKKLVTGPELETKGLSAAWHSWHTDAAQRRQAAPAPAICSGDLTCRDIPAPVQCASRQEPLIFRWAWVQVLYWLAGRNNVFTDEMPGDATSAGPVGCNSSRLKGSAVGGMKHSQCILWVASVSLFLQMMVD